MAEEEKTVGQSAAELATAVKGRVESFIEDDGVQNTIDSVTKKVQGGLDTATEAVEEGVTFDKFKEAYDAHSTDIERIASVASLFGGVGTAVVNMAFQNGGGDLNKIFQALTSNELPTAPAPPNTDKPDPNKLTESSNSPHIKQQAPKVGFWELAMSGQIGAATALLKNKLFTPLDMVSNFLKNIPSQIMDKITNTFPFLGNILPSIGSGILMVKTMFNGFLSTLGLSNESPSDDQSLVNTSEREAITRLNVVASKLDGPNREQITDLATKIEKGELNLSEYFGEALSNKAPRPEIDTKESLEASVSATFSAATNGKNEQAEDALRVLQIAELAEEAEPLATVDAPFTIRGN